jgi:hypothetical protein
MDILEGGKLRIGVDIGSFVLLNEENRARISHIIQDMRLERLGLSLQLASKYGGSGRFLLI